MSENDERAAAQTKATSQTETAGPTDKPLPLREITDARTLRALSHPVRLALIEAMTISGVPMTATEVGEQIGESPTTCSFHLRQLAKYGFVEEAGGGKGRARPWRMKSIGMSFGSSHSTDPEYEIASRTLAQMYRERSFARYRTWMDTQAAFPREWRDAAETSEYVFYVTASELAELNQELTNILINRYLERLNDPALRPAGSVPVEMLTMSFPIQLPDGEPGEAGPAGGADK